MEGLPLGGDFYTVINPACLGGRNLVGKPFKYFRKRGETDDINSLGFSADFDGSLREKDDRFGKGSGDPPFSKDFPDQITLGPGLL